MLNSMSDADHAAPAQPPAVRRRLSADERRRQLVAIGLARIVETPIQDLSLDDIATEAGISRGLLFHYFPTKTDFYLACIAAAGRRMLRTTAPDEGATGEEQVETVTRLMIEQIERRRGFYLALVHGHGVADPRVSEVMDSVRDGSTERVMAALGVPEARRDVVRAWWAYTEDRALTWSAVPTGERPVPLSRLVEECVAALHALLRISS
ncbi:TetR/AcrR family transcriptional regulator [Nocardioides sp. STR2]|jgi:AcrR family transcriptional regulator|uniref:TetR/AcrR family transcriptional regulator n=1 Tax=Nocardioides pini TaxID=2975053 RepID=A0ABT4C9L0_9ACTN|nr:TetR/AcrR family transcriptional regulator [Nocardioides pini]MCY4725650.1 TetR/AcrR family transcriptional regulator [Nocardioides pini]